MKNTANAPGSQPAFTCAGCAKRHTFEAFASGVLRAQGSRKVRRRIEKAVRKQRGAERVVMLDAAVPRWGVC